MVGVREVATKGVGWASDEASDLAAMGRIHVCDAGAAPCDDPEDQMVVAIGHEGLGFHRGHRQMDCPGRPPSGMTEQSSN